MSTPISIEEIAKNGVDCSGLAVLRVTLELANGSQITVELKNRKTGSEDEKRTESAKKKIFDLLETKQMPLTRFQIAKGLGYKSQSGWIGTVMASMVDSGDLVDEDGYLNQKS